jgi:hypothetical protein
MKIHEILKIKEQNTGQGSRGQIGADLIWPTLEEIQPSIRITGRREQVAPHSAPSDATRNRQR